MSSHETIWTHQALQPTSSPSSYLDGNVTRSTNTPHEPRSRFPFTLHDWTFYQTSSWVLLARARSISSRCIRDKSCELTSYHRGETSHQSHDGIPDKWSSCFPASFKDRWLSTATTRVHGSCSCSRESFQGFRQSWQHLSYSIIAWPIWIVRFLIDVFQIPSQ